MQCHERAGLYAGHSLAYATDADQGASSHSNLGGAVRDLFGLCDREAVDLQVEAMSDAQSGNADGINRLHGLRRHGLAVRQERHHVATDLDRQFVRLAALRVGLLNRSIVRPVTGDIRDRRTGALPDQELAILPDYEIGVALLVVAKVLASHKQAVRHLVTGKLGHREGGLGRVRSFPVLFGVEEDHVRTCRRVEAFAHRDELESRSAFFGVVESAKPAADFDAVSGRRTWRRTAPTTGPGPSALRAITAGPTLRRGAATILSNRGKRERKYDNCRKPPVHRSLSLRDEEAVS